MLNEDQKPTIEEDRTVQSVRASNDAVVPIYKLEVGDLFAGRFQVLGRLGSGGVGDVFKVEDIVVKRNVALKILQPGSYAHASSIPRFQQEARAAGSLDHPNIAKLLEFDVADGVCPYLVMEYCSGESLSEYIQSHGSLSELFARDVVTQISQALEHAHAKGVVHRDLKPANVILVKANGVCTVKVIDFGIAKILSSDDSPGLTKTGEIFGSPYYMSPEQAESGMITGSSDQYSLGCLFYECLTGAPPHMGKTSIETLIKHRTDVPRSLKEASLGSEFSDGTQAIVERLLHKDPTDRFPSIVDVTRALKESPTHAPVSAVRSERAASNKRGIYLTILFAVLVLSLTMFIAHQGTEKPAETGETKSAAVELPPPIKVAPTPVEAKLSDTPSKDAAWVYQERSNTQKETFDLKDEEISNEGLSGFPSDKGVTWLDLRGNRKITNDGMKHISHLPLKFLDLSLTGINDGALKIIPLGQLLDLRLGWTDVDDDGIKSLSKAKKLTALILEGTRIEGRTLGCLGALKNLETLGLNNTKVSSLTIGQLQKLKLRTLFLDQTAINDNDLQLLVHMPLKTLSIRGTRITNAGLEYLSRIKTLENLNAKDCLGISKQEIEKLQIARPGLSVQL